MPQLRKDPIIGRWVIISTERARRPDDFSIPAKQKAPEGQCPFCAGNEARTPAEVYAERGPKAQPDTPGWDVRVVPSISPFMSAEGELGRRGVGLYDVMNNVGVHEVVIETPEHINDISQLPESQFIKIIRAQRGRMLRLKNDKRFKYVLLYKNYGHAAGASAIQHACSQLIATPVNPKRVKEELVGARKYYDFRERCIFCDIITEEASNKERVIEQNGAFIAMAPFASRFPFEVWILPKKHGCDFYAITEEEIESFARISKNIFMRLRQALNDAPYNYVLHTAPFRHTAKAGYWKTIDSDYHWHFEIMPRLTQVAGFEWGTGFYINPTPPELAAGLLREVKI